MSSNGSQPLPILDFAKYCMMLAGIWRLSLPTENPLLRRLYRFYSAFIQVYFPMFLISLSLQLTISITDNNAQQTLSKTFEQLSYVIGLLTVGVAAVLYQTNSVKEIITYIIAEDADIARSADKEELRSHSEQVQFCRRSSFGIAILSVWMGISMCSVNYWTRFQIDKYKGEHNGSVEMPFAYDLYYYKLNKVEHASILLLINDASVVVCGLLAASTKIFFFSCIIFPSSILKRLQIRFRRMAVSEERALVVMKEFVLQHQRVIRFIGKLNASMKYVIFLEFLLNSLNIATVSFQFISVRTSLLSIRLSILHYFKIILFFAFLFTQTFVLGWSANEIKIQSLALANAVYSSPWYQQCKTIKGMLLIMMVRAQRPLVLTIGPFDAMTTQSALAIMKASYSYISVMMNNYN
ncbi:odorant receptor 63a-like [Cylas formicarius]|uniref:odorant receptor 63a-like n=1 Tax=Cylas formicarius TaxID=197179 RepID=UPI0029589281|nr:odorant receptor 63a-like [Cylas formicarius]